MSSPKACAAARATPTLDNDELLDMGAVCRLFGGTRPLDPSTIYKGIRRGRFPKPVSIGPQTARWLRSECLSALERIIAESRRVAAEQQ
jgi:predicted DNA-binding transcriptional regulator AlpA